MRLNKIRQFIQNRRSLSALLRPTQIIIFGFMAVILTGSILLSLPFCTKSGVGTPFLDALFTATSATCVTGLVVVDTAAHWNIFGQLIILALIQIGGLGFITMACLVSFLLRRKISLRERLIMVESFNQSEIQGIVWLAKRVLMVTFMVEGSGALILSARLIPEFGFLGGIYRGIFTAVSAFCNAGFDVIGKYGAFASLTPYVGDFVINVTIMGLVVFGGLGFFVWADLYRYRPGEGYQIKLQTRLVLFMTVALTLFGAVMFFVFEYNNTETIGYMSLPHKVLASFFQSVTTRTAGFNTIDQGAMTEMSKFVSMILMFIGGSPGSTAGGVKTVTLAVILITVHNIIRGSKTVNVHGKHIGHGIILRAVSIILIAILVLFVSILVMSFSEQAGLQRIMFEAVSAFGTVGLTQSLTPDLTGIGKGVIMILMFFGRVGVLTIGFAIAAKQHDYNSKIRYPRAQLMVG
ncbi:MAG: Trk family potassium uptake protein [Clostridia bacterium]|nr:Trk family potassium uptake protein [Clostridia bacterium]